MKAKAIYLDYAAATPVDSAVVKAMQPYLSSQFYNPSALYLSAKSVKQAVESARHDIAKTIGARPGEIIFTAGGTEANNLAVAGIMARYPGKEVIISSIEHESIREPAKQYADKEVTVDKQGRIDLSALKKSISDTTVLVSIMHANNEIGTIQPIKEVAKLIAEVRKDRRTRGVELPIYLHSDACQATNYLDIHVSRLGVDMMTLNGGKMYGPKQSGILYVKAGVTIEPIIRGGGQESGLRSGTENVTAIIGFAQALSLAQNKRPSEAVRLQRLQKLFLERVQQNVPRAVVNGSLKHRLPNNVHLTLEGFDNERLLMELDERGIMCATGSACSASKEEVSHVLKSVGLSDQQAQASLRFTMGRATTETEVRTTVDTLAKIVSK